MKRGELMRLKTFDAIPYIGTVSKMVWNMGRVMNKLHKVREDRKIKAYSPGRSVKRDENQRQKLILKCPRMEISEEGEWNRMC